MSRENLIKQLEAYRDNWEAENATATRFIDFVSRNPNCFERSLQEGHVTGSAWIVDKSGKKTLLTHHRKLDAWFQLGGHADGEQDVFKVSLNEAIEESGIQNFTALQKEIFDIDIHLIPARKQDPEHYHYDIRYLLQPTDSEELSMSSESLDLQWVAIENLEDYTCEESMLRMRRKWISSAQYAQLG
ncbi:NUDIX hydrolase [Pelagicoccus albus]|uniref:NUDIX hydrolase n=1 Tax=Pelagicoccus albus TaxID=415222 RepID=A0A7X1E9R4_9BACT|nr:NUDIX hydrolase [Pelagicoccus albus]MBC2608135.1 NUDIX hydrolase [Pelagicoccus albus]